MHTPTTRAKDFIAQLQPHASKRLMFEHDGRRIQPGYHVTEIKAASFRSLDCGARPQQWEETIVQLWDVADRPEQGHIESAVGMSVRKFLSIYGKVDRDVGVNGDAEIKFEWGDANAPAVFYTLNAIHEEGDLVVVSLEPVRASCKPRDEWWLSSTSVSEMSRLQSSNACCAPATASELILIADAAPVASVGCCGDGAQGRDAACCS